MTDVIPTWEDRVLSHAEDETDLMVGVAYRVKYRGKSDAWFRHVDSVTPNAIGWHEVDARGARWDGMTQVPMVRPDGTMTARWEREAKAYGYDDLTAQIDAAAAKLGHGPPVTGIVSTGQPTPTNEEETK